VGLYDINAGALETLLSSGEFPNACGCHCDVTRRESIAAALEHFSSHSGGTYKPLGVNRTITPPGIVIPLFLQGSWRVLPTFTVELLL
jgi:hypothetical protein